MSVPSSPAESGSKFRVAICGAGIGGLVLAITIGKYDPSIPIDLYEAHASIDTPGVGISIWKKTHEVMMDLGLYDDFRQIFIQDPESTCGPKYRRSDIRQGGYDWFQLDSRHGRSPMHRQHMVAVLEKHVPVSCKIHFEKRLVNYVESEQDAHTTPPIRLEFADGTVATADVLVGADGIRSAVRKTMSEAASKDNGNHQTNSEQYIDPTFTGMFIYRSLVSAEVLRKESPENIALKGMMGYAGKGRLFTTYPIAKDNIINVAAYICNPSLTGTHYDGHWVSDVARGELVEHFDDFEPDVRAIVKLCEKPSKWALHVVKPLPFFVRKRVGLIGDACHAMTPHFGVGAGQAIDDAFILGRLIAHPLMSPSRIQDALCIYEEIRLPIAHSIADLSLSAGWMYAFMSPTHYEGTRQADLDDHNIGVDEKDGMEARKRAIIKRWDLVDETRSALQAWEDAESKLHCWLVE